MSWFSLHGPLRILRSPPAPSPRDPSLQELAKVQTSEPLSVSKPRRPPGCYHPFVWHVTGYALKSSAPRQSKQGELNGTGVGLQPPTFFPFPPRPLLPHPTLHPRASLSPAASREGAASRVKARELLADTCSCFVAPRLPEGIEHNSNSSRDRDHDCYRIALMTISLSIHSMITT